MLILNTKHLEKHCILKLKCDSIWDDKLKFQANVKETLENIKLILQNGNQIKLIFNTSVGDFPPLFEILRIIAFLGSIRNLIKEKLDFTILYIKEDKDKWLDYILSIYTPVRPIHVAKSKQEIKDLLNGGFLT